VNPSANYGVARVKARLFSRILYRAMAIDKESTSTGPVQNRGPVLTRTRFLRKLSIYSYWPKQFSYAPHTTGKKTGRRSSVDYKSNLVRPNTAIRRATENTTRRKSDLLTGSISRRTSQTSLSRPAQRRGPIRELNFEAFCDAPAQDTHGVLQTQNGRHVPRELPQRRLHRRLHRR